MSTHDERRQQRELRTIRAMIGIYCRDHHATRGALCGACGALWEYALERVERCPFGVDKPTCAKCTVHCYKPAMRADVRNVMRYAGPRMMWRHPWLTVLHMMHGRGEAPVLRKRSPDETRRS